MRISDWSSVVCSSDHARRSTSSNDEKSYPRPGSPHWTACSLFPNRSRVNMTPISTPDLTPGPLDPPYLRGLNGPQRQGVLTTAGPVLMLQIGRVWCREKWRQEGDVREGPAPPK